jgi:hypothetical protein
MMDLLTLRRTLKSLRTAVADKDVKTILTILGDLFKLASELLEDDKRVLFLGTFSAAADGLTEDEKEGLDPATLALLLMLLEAGLKRLVEWIKKRRGL